MFDQLRAWLLRVLQVPPEPEPPFGDPGSIHVFRASRKFYQLRLLGWTLGQAAALVGLVIGVGIIAAVERKTNELRATQPAAPTVQPAGPAVDRGRGAGESRRGRRQNVPPLEVLTKVAARVPPSLFALLWILKVIGLIVYVGQLLVTYATLRLDYEMRWHIVTDRSLRIRTGLWKVQEMTMSFANLQQVMLSQGPLQRLLGIADVRVQSAGGGGASEDHHHGHGASMHTGIFHGVDNATEVRDLVLARLRHFRETGLGDPDEMRHAPSVTAGTLPRALTVGAADADVVVAAREVLAEARQLRASLVVSQ